MKWRTTTRYPVIVWLCCVLDVWRGIALLFSPEPLSTTALSVFMGLAEWHRFVGLCAIAAAVAAVAPVVRRVSPVTFAALMYPQFFFLAAGAITSGLAMAQRHYADLVQRPFAFISTDQIIYVLLPVAYFMSIIQPQERLDP